MRYLFIIFCSLFISQAYCQGNKYTFYVELNHYSNAPEFKSVGGKLVYDGKDNNEKKIFDKYDIFDFYQAFPDAWKERTLSFFTVTTSNKNLVADLMREFPAKYIFSEDITDLKIEPLETYTNDYGTTIPSPMTNLGVNASNHNLDYIEVPRAWDYTTGDEKVYIGINDFKINTTDIDLKFKTTILTPSFAQSYPYDFDDVNTTHGTAVASIAAAQGNNAHGTVGVCSDCSILENGAGMNNLFELANNGAKVINMSWVSRTYSSAFQVVLDDLHEANIVLVAAAGNTNPEMINTSTGLPYGYPNYYYPASYNHVISVTGVNHKYQWNESYYTDAEYGQVCYYVEDQVSPLAASNYNGNGPYPVNIYTLNFNDMIDICAPGYQYFRYAIYIEESSILYGNSTSGSAPYVTGTVGLMFSHNDCLLNHEVEDILKLTSKNLEVIPGNVFFAGKIGSGKLETGDAVEFVDEMMQPTGNALIDGNDFYRFNFDLKHINNKLTISNQTFRDSCTADFTAKNAIDVQPGSDFKPDATGFTDLKIDSEIDVCPPPMPRMAMANSNEQKKLSVLSNTRLYPNPNDGNFEINLGRELKDALVIEVFDMFGKVVYRNSGTGLVFTVNVPGLSTGMYIVKLSSGNFSETLKFIKQ